MSAAEQEDRLLLARAEDLLRKAARGEVAVTAYLTPREQQLLRRSLALPAGLYELDGGYAQAERARMFFYPEYFTMLDPEDRAALLAPIKQQELFCVRITGSGYRELSHRDHLGAILNLGIKREAVGDLCLLSAQEAVLFADRLLFDFLCEQLSRVANDAVRVSHFLPPEGFDGGRRFQAFSDTVASPRADAVVAAICRTSREKAQGLMRAGAVEIAYETEGRFDREVKQGDVITVRGEGKFIVRALSDKTKKGRFRLLFDRYL